MAIISNAEERERESWWKKVPQLHLNMKIEWCTTLNPTNEYNNRFETKMYSE